MKIYCYYQQQSGVFSLRFMHIFRHFSKNQSIHAAQKSTCRNFRQVLRIDHLFTEAEEPVKIIIPFIEIPILGHLAFVGGGLLGRIVVQVSGPLV